MATTLPLLGSEAMQISPPGNTARGVSGARADAFAQAMDRAGQQPPEEAADASAVVIGDSSRIADDQVRARQALELGVPPEASRTGTGDAILGGLQKLRGVFDASQHKISSIPATNVSGIEAMVEMQREMVHYSLLLDVTSKLTGKTTQAVDQLMKGQ
ncbi:type III secretion system inner rod subunit SctI [Pseudochelatococcus sp. B33]